MRHPRPSPWLALALAAASAAGCSGLDEVRPVIGGRRAGVSVACTLCHGDADRAATPENPFLPAAPPLDAAGSSDAASPGVGAHAAHLAGGAVRAAVPCAECHAVPSDASHATTRPPKLAWGPLASARGASPSYAGGSCAATYCHGATLGAGGSRTAPTWTGGAGEAACGACHGIPPPASTGHPTVAADATACSACHPATVKPDGTIDVAGGRHVDGNVDVGGAYCTSCHGDAGRAATALNPDLPAAPPRDAAGRTSTAASGVGAHQAHLTAGRLAGELACRECHAVPSDASHASARPPKVSWGPLASAGGAAPSWDGATCSNVYCHGATLRGGTRTAPAWTTVDGSQVACGTCHGIAPTTGRHSVSAHVRAGCGACHPGYGTSTVDAALHVNGVKDVGNRVSSWNASTRRCVGCHGGDTW